MTRNANFQFVVFQIAILTARGFVILEKGAFINDSGVAGSNLQDPTTEETTIRHYARHVLCRNFEGKRMLYIALKPRICGMSLSFIENFVIDLCKYKNTMLDKLVEELFDIDGNGFISHFEKKSIVDRPKRSEEIRDIVETMADGQYYSLNSILKRTTTVDSSNIIITPSK